MTERELREIKRRFRPERGNIARIVGCFVNANKQIVSRISQSIGLEDSIVSEKLLCVMKKTLSGGLGTNLCDIAFSTRDVNESEEHKLLMTLVRSHLSDADALEKFYGRVIESLEMEENYVILLLNDVYDVFTKAKDGESVDSSEVFSYVICAVCPVKNLAESLSYKEADKLFHMISPSGILSSPMLGFMFPTFDDRRTNIYNALYYTRGIAENYPVFAERIFRKTPPMPPKAQKEAFGECLVGALGEECTYEVVRSVYSQIDAMVEAHKESRDPEPLCISKETVKTVLSECGIEEERLGALEERFDESFGKGAMLTPRNIIKKGKFELSTPSVQIKIDPEHRDLVSTEVINGVKYVMVRVDGPVEVNGISIDIDE